MPPVRQSVNLILQRYSSADLGDWSRCQVEFLGNHGGYSGAQLWKIQTESAAQFCLRKWPASMRQEQVDWIHSVLRQTVANGFSSDLLPLPRLTQDGQSILTQGNSLFELNSWLAGSADFHSDPSDARIQSAASTLAQFHLCCRPVHFQKCHGRELRGMLQRKKLIQELKKGQAKEIEQKLDRLPFAELAKQTLHHFRSQEPLISRQISQLDDRVFNQQICIRDIWHDHLFFQGDRVSGIVDFGAMGVDHPGTDIARLFGSLFANSAARWQHGLAAYASICELSDLELELIDVYDRSSTVLAGMNWLKWILIENRKFDSFLPIKKRIELLIQRMGDWL